MARVVNTCNFDSDYPDESFFSGYMTEERAEELVDAMNLAHGESHPRFWKVVDNDYELQPGFEP